MSTTNNAFAAVRQDVFSALIDPDRYNEKALALFLLLRFRAGCDLKIHTNEMALCDLMGVSNQTKNRTDIMSNLQQMERDGFLSIYDSNDARFFWISLEYDIFIPAADFTIIYKKEFDALWPEKTRDKLLMLLYCIKKYKHKKTNISFVSIDTIEQESPLSRSTICRGITKLEGVLDIYRARISFADGQFKEVNYYKSLCDGEITQEQVEAIAKKYYRNITSITRKHNKMIANKEN